MKRNYTKFAVRLRDLREEAGLSMVELAKAIGVSDAAICKWENGLAEPKLGYIIRLAEYFDCSTDYIMGKDGDFSVAKKPVVRVTDGRGAVVTPHVTTAAVPLSPDEESLLVTFKGLSPDMKAVLKETARAMRNADPAPNGKPKTDA